MGWVWWVGIFWRECFCGKASCARGDYGEAGAPAFSRLIHDLMIDYLLVF